MVEGSSAVRVRRSGSFRLNLPPNQAFKLFTAAGERLWVAGWSPKILGSLPQQSGLVFLTGEGLEQTIWTVIESDPDAGRVCYSRVTPGSRAGIVTVEVTASDDGSQVNVSYDLTALDAAGAASLDAYSAANFSRMMRDWQEAIEGMIAESPPDFASLVV